MKRFAMLVLGLLAAVSVAAQDSQPGDASAGSQPAKAAEPLLDDPPEAGAAVAEAAKKSPEQLAKEQAKKEFGETVERFQKIAQQFDAEILATINRARDARMRRVDIDFEQRIVDLERREAEQRKSAIKAFENFVQRYPYDNEYSPQAMFRLAELYFEEAKYAYNAADEEFSVQLELFEAKKIGKEPDAPTLDLARTIKLYDTILKRFPKFERNDGVQYLLAFCLEETGEFERSLTNYEQLVTNFPDSNFVPEVWLRIGENHFTEDRLCEALDAYRQVLNNPESSWYDKALYKVAWTHYRLDRFDAAYKRFMELIDFSDKKAEETGQSGSDLRREAVQYVAVAAVEQGWGRPATGEDLASCSAVIAQDEAWDEKQAELMDEYDAAGTSVPEVPAIDRLEQMFAAVGERTYQREVYLEVAKVLFDQAAW
ncbi:MAG: tetratricopeptide repeat protein, partial [Myxococcota bacterium]|nr:tetratricopeptide repeat protein [Myxococcota bacterium]